MQSIRSYSVAMFIALGVLLLGACGEPAEPVAPRPSPEAAAPDALLAPVARLDQPVAPRHYRLELRIDPAEARFSGTAEIELTLEEALDGFWLHGRNLDVSSIHLVDRDSQRIEGTYQEHLESGVARVALARKADAGDAVLRIEYSAPFNTSEYALFRMVRGEAAYAATQFQPIGARQAFPGFDEPGFKVPFDIALTARDGEVAIANTPEVSREDLGDGFVRHVFATTRPLPTYLVAFAVGPYDLVDAGAIEPNAVRAHEVPLRGLTARGLGPRIEYALADTPALLGALEEYFGTPYPYPKLDLIAVPQSFGGAMENPGAVTYDEYLILLDGKSPIAQRRDYLATHAHEIAHMWFGNLVTPEWWDDLWLNESFASWMMNKAAHSHWPDGEFERETLKDALAAMATDSLAAARQIRQPVEHNERITAAFDTITYQKGGGVLAMLARYLGADAFQAGIRLHMERFADGSASAADFIESLASASGRSEIDAAFRSFVEQPGVPLVTARLDCEDARNPRLVVSQQRYAPLGSGIDAEAGLWHIPLCVSHGSGESRQTSCAMLDERSASIELATDTCPAALHPNADGAGYYRFSLDEAGWAALIADTANLAPAEAMVMADSLDAAFRAGAVPARTWLEGMLALLAHPAWDVADAAINRVEQIVRVVPNERMEPVRQALGRMVRPRYQQLAEATDTGSQLLGQRMQRLLIVVAKDQGMREPAARQAAAYLGLHGKPDPSALALAERETILSVGVQELGAPFFDLLLEQAASSEDPALRSDATGAIARVEDPELVGRLQAAVLGGAFKGMEMFRVLNRQMQRPETTELTRAWLEANADTLIAMVPEFFRSNVVPSLGAAFCSAAQAEQWEAFVAAHAAQLPGHEKDLAEAIERIRLCTTLREQGAEQLLDAFAAIDG